MDEAARHPSAQEPPYAGVLMIGDPHLEGRQPGFRCDDYPQVILEKLAWALEHARRHRLLPVLLGDLFDKPRDNPTWMLGRLIDLFRDRGCIGIYGNHDCADPQLSEHDSLSLLLQAGSLQRVSAEHPWRGWFEETGEATGAVHPVVIGGSSYREPIPKAFEPGTAADGRVPVVLWLTHHDLRVPGYEAQGRHVPGPIPGIDWVINGHIHRALAPVVTETTHWLTPGNISRRSRSDAVQEHVPTVLHGSLQYGRMHWQPVTVPHAPVEEVFHPVVIEPQATTEASSFVAGLAALQALRTDSGAGLHAFLEQNLTPYAGPVAEEIRALAREVTQNDE